MSRGEGKPGAHGERAEELDLGRLSRHARPVGRGRAGGTSKAAVLFIGGSGVGLAF